MTNSLLTIPPRIQDLGGFSVRRLLPHRSRRMVGPWVFFDHMGPADFPPGPGIDVRPHPHINLATVTYLFEGEILHRDSLGSLQAIRPGDINLMIAGSGIVHSEREADIARQSQRRLHGLQLWLALPRDHEETEPEFHHYPAASVPVVDVDGVPTRIIMGSAYDQRSPVKTFSPTLFAEARLRAGQSLPLPDGVAELAVYTVAGSLAIGGGSLPAHAMGVLGDGDGKSITALEDSIVAIIGGHPIGQRHVWWNFVSSRRERIEEAKQDWRERRFAEVPGDSDEFIPLPDEG
jgi:redox-sensitive bicupin YhaK (pirin superfamily)